MIDLSTPESVEEVYEREKEQYEGTVLDGFHRVLAQHEPVIQFIVDTSEAYTPDSYIGSEKALVTEGVEVDEEAFIEQIRQSDAIALSDFLSFEYSLNEFIVSRLQEETQTWAEMRASIAETSGYTVDEEDVEEMVQENIETMIEAFDMFIEELQGDIDATQVTQIQEMKHSIATTSKRALLLQSYEQRKASIKNRLKRLQFVSATPQVGDYFVYEVQPHPTHIANAESYSFEFSGATRYNIVGKLTGSVEETIEGGVEDITKYTFDIIAYNSEVKQLYNQLWLFNDDKPYLEPKNQDDVTFFKTSPLASIETKVQISQLPS